MSLETLLEAARYVEQQEQRAKHIQSLLPRPAAPHPTPQPHFLTVTSSSQSPTHSFKIVSPVALPQLSGSPPAALVAVAEHTAALVVTARPTGVSAQQPVVEIVTKPLPLLNGFDKPTLLISTDTPTSPPTVSSSHQSADSSHPPTTKPLPPPAAPPANSVPTQSGNAAVSGKRHIVLNSHSSAVVSSTTNGNATLMGHGLSVMRSGTREVHNKLEKNRRAHLKECFDVLKKQLPPQQDEKKSSNLSILHSALRHIQALKKRERDNEHEMERLAREKIAAQQRLAALKKELGSQWDNIDFNCLLPENGGSGIVHQTITTSSTSPPTLVLKEEPLSDDALSLSSAHKFSPLHGSTALPAATIATTGGMSTHMSVLGGGAQGAVYHPGLAMVALVGNVSKGMQMVQSPVTHIIPQLNGKVVPLGNGQYLMKPVVVVSTPSAGPTAISPRQS